MAAPAGTGASVLAAGADGGGILFRVSAVRFRVTMSMEQGPPKRFDPDAHSFLDVVQWHLDAHPADRDAVMYVGKLALGTDVSLDTPLRDWMRVLDMRDDGHTPVDIRLSNVMSYAVEYEKIKYALAAHQAGLVWPLWDKADTDPINMQVVGTYDNYRARSGAFATDRRDDNQIGNLIGLRRGRHTKFVNMHALAQSLVHGNRREPVFHTEIERIDEFGRHLLTALQRSTHPSKSDPMHTLLPIIDLVTLAVDRRYGSAFAAFERRMANRKQQQKKQIDNSQAAAAAGARAKMVDQVRAFVRNHPSVALGEVEAGVKQARIWVSAMRDMPLTDLLALVREEHRRPSSQLDGDTSPRGMILTYMRTFMRAHPSVTLDVVEDGIQKMREFMREFPLDELTAIVREEHERAMAAAASSSPAAAAGGGVPVGAMSQEMLRAIHAGIIHGHVRNRPTITLAEVEALVRDKRDASESLADWAVFVRETYREAVDAAAAAPQAVAQPKRNPLIALYRNGYWSGGGQDVAPIEHARVVFDAIARGGIDPATIREFQRMFQAVGDIHVRYADIQHTQAGRDERRAHMTTAVHSNYESEPEPEPEPASAAGASSVNRLAGRLAQTQLSQW